MAKRILIVDDAKFMREMLKQFLDKGGYEIAGEAADGEEALMMYKATSPDLVTMDITMTGLNGIEGLRRIMQYDPDAKVIMVSSMAQQHLIVEAINNGAKDFIVKPFVAERLIESIERYAGEAD